MQQRPKNKQSWELAIEKLANATVDRFEKLKAKVDQMASFNRNLEVQLGQISNAINSRDQGDVDKKNNVEISDENEQNEMPPLTPPVKPYVPPIPFPQRLKQNKVDKQFEKFLEVFKQLRINIPFADALAQIPAYVQFLKEIMSNKRKLEDYKTIALTEECSAVIQKKLPQKLRDPESFSIPCTIGDIDFSKTLCDLGVSVSLMPLSVCKKLGLKEIQPTTISL
ncbi:uncharacterized protein LOC127812718 [Diospyros lotus]|uniref:uncharacterized protein LOC127812718 n=1 Tax=Diospyros lotus TaxID=55363 RepID=UPI0022589819|nr:uncharacterized protein LOC127812718 [Diospyros lotus]